MKPKPRRPRSKKAKSASLTLMKNLPSILADRETVGRLRKQKCFNPRVSETPSASPGGCFVRLGRDEQHKQNFSAWLKLLRRYLEMERGRNSRLAEHLGVNRQTCWRWFFQEHGRIPAWAAVTTNIWLAGKLTPQAYNLLKRAACPPGERQAKPSEGQSNLTLL